MTDRRLVKLKVNGITIPFPEDIEQGLDEGHCLFSRSNYGLY